MVTIHSETREITRSGQYWAFAHFSRTIRRGAKRFDSTGKLKDVDHAGFENQSGQKVLVLTNNGAAQSLQLKLGSHAAEVRLADDSITTLSWD